MVTQSLMFISTTVFRRTDSNMMKLRLVGPQPLPTAAVVHVAEDTHAHYNLRTLDYTAWDRTTATPANTQGKCWYHHVLVNAWYICDR